LKPGKRYFRHDQDSWPTTTGMGFDIHTDQLEDQLAVEANALSPFNFEDDDKENNVDTAYEETRNLLDGVSVISASQYRSAEEDTHILREDFPASGAFYDVEHGTDYGLGGSDGAHDEGPATVAKPTFDAISVLASGSQLPRSSNVRKQAGDDIDSVLGSSYSATAEEVDSVCGL
jgi:hypothetical protein